MFNKVVLLGNLTRDPELRYLPSGGPVCATGLATNRRFKKQDGTQGEEVCFVDVTFFGRTAEVVNQYLKRGSKILVEGRLKFDQWNDQNGQKRSKHSVVAESMQMLGGRGDNAGGYDSNNSYDNGGGNYGSNQNNNYNQQNNGAPTQNNSYNSAQQNNYGAGSNQAQTENIPDIDIDEDEVPF